MSAPHSSIWTLARRTKKTFYGVISSKKSYELLMTQGHNSIKSIHHFLSESNFKASDYNISGQKILVLEYLHCIVILAMHQQTHVTSNFQIVKIIINISMIYFPKMQLKYSILFFVLSAASICKKLMVFK